ncbi:MAG TPA: heavy metal sensor histidine kinase [Chthoniobacterales bacterium]|jgi:two-component system heavy metal sensor histidine kinase CusS|nr:heavy metal sensor histidine kinase [Chthoniobacterales bacterium]
MSLKPIKSLLADRAPDAPRPWSIVFRLALLFTIAAAAMLLFAMAAAYWVVVEHVDHDNDRYLTDKLAAIRADIAVDYGPQSLSRELSIIRAADKAYAARVLDRDGNVVAESPRMRKILPIDVFPQAVSVPGQRPATAIYHARNGKTFALVTSRADLEDQPLTLQLAQERTHDERFRGRYAGLLTGIVGCAVITCAGVGLLVIRRSLMPLKHLAQSIERTGATHLHERVPIAGWPDELQPLAIGYNKMLERLENSFTRLSHFSADLAHELRTPIAILRGEAEGALTKPRAADEYREVIESGLEELQRLSGMIDNLLFIARAETIGSLSRSYFDGRAAIEKIREFYEAVSQEQGVEIRCRGEGGIYAEPVLFRRALINLITNALRFTPSGGEVVVSLASRNGGSEVSVADTGCGISSEHVPNVFNRFFRGDAQRNAAGSGLGLSIVKSIMEIHKGGVSVQSEKGKGTVVTLEFPDQNGATAS